MPDINMRQPSRTENEGKGGRFGPPQAEARDARPCLRQPDDTNQDPRPYPEHAAGSEQGQGPSGARRRRGWRSQSLIRQACVIPRSPVAVALSRAVDDLASGHAPLVSFGLRRANPASASLRSALAPARCLRRARGRVWGVGSCRCALLAEELRCQGERVAIGQLKPALAIPLTPASAAPPLVEARPLSRRLKGLRRTKPCAYGELGPQDSADPVGQGGRSPLENPPRAAV